MMILLIKSLDAYM
jgi:hypothetical protein